MPIIVKHRPNLEVCSVSRAGIGMVQSVVEQAKWNIGDKIEVGFIGNAKCLLLRSVSSEDGFKLAYANTRKKPVVEFLLTHSYVTIFQQSLSYPRKIFPQYFSKVRNGTSRCCWNQSTGVPQNSPRRVPTRSRKTLLEFMNYSETEILCCESAKARLEIE